MPPLISADDATHPPEAGLSAAVEGRPGRRLAGIRRRFWWLLAATLVCCALSYPPPWQAVLRAVLVHLAAQRGGVLTIARMEGGPLDPIHLFGVRFRQETSPDEGTDLRIDHAELTFASPLPVWRKAGRADGTRIVLEGVTGRWDFAAAGTAPPGHGSRLPGRWLDRLADRLVPSEFYLHGDDVSFIRHRYRLHLRGLRLTGERDGAGLVVAREAEIAGPGFENTLLNRHGQTRWQGDRLSVGGLELSPGVQLTETTVDLTHLKRQRLDWECTLTAMGGEVRGQGAVNFVHPRLALEVAGSLHRLPVAPLARLLGLAGPAGGEVDQGSFSFRGDPENWTSAEMWLAARATNFRWGQRDWQNLELRATVLHQRIQVRRLELQQNGNRVSLVGECPLLTTGQATGRWWTAGLSCNVDARLNDLHALTQLFGTRLPDLSGRMSVNGTLQTTPGRGGIDGYLNVEGSRLTLGGAPLDYLHSTLLFRGDELEVADVQATRGKDYFTGRARMNLAGPPGYQGELHVSMEDPALYAPALAEMVGEAAGQRAAGLLTPIRLEGVFSGPDGDGKTDCLTFGGGGLLPPQPDGEEGDDPSEQWPELTLGPVRGLPSFTSWRF